MSLIVFSDLLSELVEVMGAEFEPQFRRVWPCFASLIAAKPGSELRAAMLGLIGRVGTALEAATTAPNSVEI